jgi:hypothetical protein
MQPQEGADAGDRGRGSAPTQGSAAGSQPLASDPEPRAWELELPVLGRIPCPVCGHPIGAVRGSKAAICSNCGFKDGCC